MTTFNEFDPLKAKQAPDSEVTIRAMKRELTNILDSYVGWYDPFCELIQNALDSVEERASRGETNYVPQIRIIINIQDNSVIVSDNGVGLTKDKYEQFLAPSFSFKSGNTRGHKGVGATYLAYCFNHIQICTKTADFSATGKMINARTWLSDENPAGNPKVQPDPGGSRDAEFNSFDSGVSIYMRFDKTTYPSDLSWIRSDTAEQWFVILSIKTGLGAFFTNDKVKVNLTVIDSQGNTSIKEHTGIAFHYAHQAGSKSQPVRRLREKQEQLLATKGKDFKMPSAMTNLDAIYDTVSTSELGSLIDLDDFEKEICQKYNPTVYFCFVYSVKVWQSANEGLGLRQGVSIITPGIQIAANNMPQGEVIQVPLMRNIGRQNQMQVVIHFENCRGDLGRKGFQKEIVDFSKSIARKLTDKPVQQFRYTLRPVTGVKDDLVRENAIDEWKDQMVKHETDCPLRLVNENFFIPMRQIAITSIPTREQDVIALFNQLIAGGVVRGIRIMSTNERFTYDGMYRVVFSNPSELHIYDAQTNPLGVQKDYVAKALESKSHFESKPKILEYKYSLDALIEDIGNGDKNPKDIGLVVVWETGDDYQGNYHVTSLLDPDDLWQRQYHGVTHVMTNLTSGQREMDLIVIKELIEYLNNPQEVIPKQREKYDAGK
ncbi:MAG: ATP-binding protein [Nitrospirales bacterium]|nr:ATP-binding protein [Nitrospirales bacterium]